MSKCMELMDVEELYSRASSSKSFKIEGEDERELMWAALESLPTFTRSRTALIKSIVEADDGKEKCEHKEVDVRKLGNDVKQKFMEKVLRIAEVDNQHLLQKLDDRFVQVGIQLPTVEVRFEHLTIEAQCYIGSRALPTLWNTAQNLAESTLGIFGINLTKRTTFTILDDVSGIIQPSRMTLLLGPPSSGKTTLLLALAGKLDPALKTTGEVKYNGYKLNEFVPQKTAAYISQNDNHVPSMTVKETLDFSARCQGIGARYEFLEELIRREKVAGIYPEPEVDFFMKATAVDGVTSTLQTDYTLRLLGLDICSDTIVGDEMRRGISGGQKKRVTTGEIIVGPTKTLFMDEISTGLDSSTTFQIVKCLQQVAHLGKATILMSLLQPAPETFDLFDDIILLSDGIIVYQGPKEHVLEFFDTCGFSCPERKSAPDFLQEVTSRKDQEQYWRDKNIPYSFVSVTKFSENFKKYHVALNLSNELSVPFDKQHSHDSSLVFSKHPVPSFELLKASFAKEWLLINRNSFFYIFKTIQIIVMAIITSTLFIRTNMHTETENDGTVYIGAILFSLVANTFNGFAELSLTISRLPVFYKQRDLLFYPAWVFTLPNFVLAIPISFVESLSWVTVTYFTIGFSPEANRFFKQLLLIFLIQQVACGLFKAIAGICRTMIIANTGGALSVLAVFVMGGFILPRDDIPKWLLWGYWVSPLTYGYNALAANEFLAPRWMNKFAPDGKRLGLAVLKNVGVFPEDKWFWIGAAALLGFVVLLNVLFTLALTFLNPIGKPQSTRPEEKAIYMGNDKYDTEKMPCGCTIEMKNDFVPQILSSKDGTEFASKRGMVLPFSPLAMSFDEVNYYVDMPPEMKEQGVIDKRLRLLNGITGAFRPGVLTALMGVSGAGKTTLMDVLAGRKTGGYIEGSIMISGYLKNQATFARISGYCEQNDVHSPQVTVRESLIYSAFLRLSKGVNDLEKMKFVDEVMELVELNNLKDAIVGMPGVSGLSTEQRKRLTIAVELVANPSIIFMDEPTSGLDSRAAAIVMRTIRNTVDTGRTVVCTIHQPSIDIFESFDELLLLKRGGRVIYSGPLGRHSEKIIEYFEAIPGVPKIKEKYNPATWMLESTSNSAEVHLNIDFAEHYMSSDLFKYNKAVVNKMKKPEPGTNDLYFSTKYSQTIMEQFKLCLWKQWLTYWRTPAYNLVRFGVTLLIALLLGTVFWKIGHRRESAIDLRIVIGCMYAATLFLGVNNCSSVQPVVAIERTVFYREKAAGMYSSLPYAISQVVVEIPYVFIQSLYYSIIIYSMMSFQWTAAKYFWFLYITFFTLLYFTYFGMMTVSFSPNHQIAAIFAGFFYGLFNLFSGFFIPLPRIPKGWVWYYWMCPVAWTVYGLIITQYGDLDGKIKVPGKEDQTIRFYVKDHYGFDADFMGVVATVLAGLPVLFALTYAFCIRSLNFQRR